MDPSRFPVPDEVHHGLSEGVALCLSGGGYRGMLFHTGALWRINELGRLPRLACVSSVSGGAICAGALAVAWDRLGFDGDGVAANFEACVVEPVRRLASHTIDLLAIALGPVRLGSTGSLLAAAYRTHLFGDHRLGDLPVTPEFLLFATNVRSGRQFMFSRDRIGDPGEQPTPAPELPLALAVAASSAYPPLLSPIVVRLADPPAAVASRRSLGGGHNVVLMDGGLYDNLGLDEAWARHGTVLISNGGGVTRTVERPRRNPIAQSFRALAIIRPQAALSRAQQATSAFAAGSRAGTYWSAVSDTRMYPAPGTLPCPHEATMALARIPTRLAKLDALVQQRLINWGYAICDAAMRSHVAEDAPPPEGFPYPGAAVG